MGNAIHAAMALFYSDPARGITINDLRVILSGHDVLDAVSIEALMEQITAFDQWWRGRWQDARARVECPVQVTMRNGQFLNGRVDLLIETQDGWILIDHKSNVGAEHRLEALAQGYGGQLQCYAEALNKSTGKPVLETWLNLPVAGKVLRLGDWTQPPVL